MEGCSKRRKREAENVLKGGWRFGAKSRLNIGQPIRYDRDPIGFHVMRYYTSYRIDWLEIGSIMLHRSRLQLIQFYVELVG